MRLLCLALVYAADPPKKLALVGDREAALSTLNGLADAAHDLSVDESKDDTGVSTVDAELAKLQAKRTSLLQDAGKKKREIFLLKTEVQTLGKGLSKTDLEEVLAREGAAAMAQATAETDAQAEAQAKAAAEAEAQAAAAAKMQAEAAEAQQAAAAAEARKAAAEAEAQRAAAEAAQQKAAAAVQAQKAAAVQAASAMAAQKAAASKASAAVAQQAAQQQRSDSSMTDSTTSSSEESLDDNGLATYLKGEEGAGEEDDADYNDSANALANAIGWDRNEVETNANKAVESLTNAIGGKQVVHQLQGMMAGLSAMKQR